MKRFSIMISKVMALAACLNDREVVPALDVTDMDLSVAPGGFLLIRES